MRRGGNLVDSKEPQSPVGRVLLLTGGGRLARIVFHALESRFESVTFVAEAPPSRWKFIKNRIHRLGLAVVLGQIAFRALVVPVVELRSRRRIAKLKRELALNDSRVDEHATRSVPSVNSLECRELLSALDPDAIVVVGSRIIGKRTLAAAGSPILNLHTGITPQYRGVYGAYWALVAQDPERCGVTIHLVDEGIDTGQVLGSAVIRPGPHDNIATYPYLQAAVAIPVLLQVVYAAIRGTLGPVGVDQGESKLWSHPTIFQYLCHLVRRGVG
jgi:folate-dependent phosphoribosylglycinamide formyltransferase PurN